MPDAPTILDPERLALLRELDGGDGDLLSAIVEEYRRDAQRQLEVLRASLMTGDPEGFRRAAHTLKGASANLGASCVTDVCARLQALGAAGTVESGGPLVDELETELGRLIPALDTLFVEA